MMEFRFEAEVKLFPQKGGWTYIPVPDDILQQVLEIPDVVVHYGLVAITATIGSSTWDTSLLPMGDGSKFLALNKKVMRREQMEVGDMVTAEFKLR